MELIIIPFLTTLALIAMQAVEFLGTRQPRISAPPVQMPEAFPAMPPAQARTLHVEEEPLERVA